MLAACDQSAPTSPLPVSPGANAQFARLEELPWSTPRNLGSSINTSANEQGPTLSRDGLTLFFGSDRAGGFGGLDIYVSQRECLACPWGTPMNLGPLINSAANDAGPGLSIDGHILFFTSARPGGQGLEDLYLSHRSNPNDDTAWGIPQAFGADINTAAVEAGAEYLQSGGHGALNVYFNRRVGTGTADIYIGSISRDGETFGPATPVAELNHPTANDQGVTLRTDAKELVFFSNRPGGLGGNDLWIATRQNATDAWSILPNPGAPLNSTGADQQPSLSFDGRTLMFASSRAGTLGGTDIYIATR
jgi:hypothetical protein